MAANNTNMNDSVSREEFMDAMHQLQQTQTQLLSALEALGQGRLGTGLRAPSFSGGSSTTPNAATQSPQLLPADSTPDQTDTSSPPAQKSGFTSRIILTCVTPYAPPASHVITCTDCPPALILSRLGSILCLWTGVLPILRVEDQSL